MKTHFGRRLRTLALALLPLWTAGCYDNGYDNGPASCSLPDQQAWLAGYMDYWYFWYALSPHPDPAAFSSVDSYFHGLLYTGTDPTFPADRWSFTQSTDAFNRFFGDGQSLGYGVSVAGIEVSGQPDQPLYVRYVEPLSDAAAHGVVRGDQVLSVNGRSASDIIASNDYSALTASAVGDQITLALRNNGADRSVTLTASVFTLTPVSVVSVVTSPLGRKLGYLVVKDMINQVGSPLDAAFAQFKSAGVQDIVLDLRYNGGGLVSVGRAVASYVAGIDNNGRTYASLRYSDKRAAFNNVDFAFNAPGATAIPLPRVFVLTGPRTCSASEQVINGLRGIGVDVIAIGDTTCGKPVGFQPVDACGTTYSAVNFESLNAQGQGRYFNGFAPTCAVAEAFNNPLGSPNEPLLGAASAYADSGACPQAGTQASKRALSLRTAARASGEPRDGQGMIAR